MYKAYDTITGWSGPHRVTVRKARADARWKNADYAAAGGFGSAIVVRDDGDGYCETLDGETVWPPHGQSTGAVRF